MLKFAPNFRIMPNPQKILWPELKQIPKYFVLYGGTAIGLRLNHRQSVDFDFFTSRKIDPDKIFHDIQLLNTSEIIQQERNTLTVIVDRDGPIKISFFGDITVGRIKDPELTNDDILLVASITDLLAHKLKVLLQRVDVKDYQDIAAILKYGEPLPEGFAGAKTLWKEFPVMECLKALCFFKNGNFKKLSNEDRNILKKAVAHVDPDCLPYVEVKNKLSLY